MQLTITDLHLVLANVNFCSKKFDINFDVQSVLLKRCP